MFAGALAVLLLERRPREEAARFVVAASMIAVTRYGSQPSYPTCAELDVMVARIWIDA
jgi:ribokinase